MNKETGEPVLIDGEKVTASTTFTAEKAEGSVEVVFEFDASAIAGTTVVAFEYMEYTGVEVAVHEDIEDEDQTVYIPDVHTTATAANTTKDHVTGANEDLIITDEAVSYTHLLFMRISMIRIRLFIFLKSTPRLWMQIPD